MILTLFTRMQKNVHVDQLSRYIPDTHIDIQNYISNCKLYIKTNTGHSPNNPSNPLEIPNEASQTIHVELLKFLTPSSGYN